MILPDRDAPLRPAEVPARSKRADALRNQQTLLAAAAAVFVTSGVEAPIREIAARARYDPRRLVELLLRGLQ